MRNRVYLPHMLVQEWTIIFKPTLSYQGEISCCALFITMLFVGTSNTHKKTQLRKPCISDKFNFSHVPKCNLNSVWCNEFWAHWNKISDTQLLIKNSVQDKFYIYLKKILVGRHQFLMFFSQFWVLFRKICILRLCNATIFCNLHWRI